MTKAIGLRSEGEMRNTATQYNINPLASASHNRFGVIGDFHYIALYQLSEQSQVISEWEETVCLEAPNLYFQLLYTKHPLTFFVKGVFQRPGRSSQQRSRL